MGAVVRTARVAGAVLGIAAIGTALSERTGPLSDVDLQLASPWTDAVLHRVLPLLLLADWLFFPPWPKLSVRAALAWLLFPLAYVAHSLPRGPVADRYPYPFLDPRPHGYDHVALHAALLTAGMALLALPGPTHGPATPRDPADDPTRTPRTR